MKIRFISDFHTEFFDFNKFQRLLEYYLPSHPDDSDTTLCCAGDMGLYERYNSTYHPLFNLLSKRFKNVVVVPGNHSWYLSSGLWGNEEVFLAGKKIPKNVHYLNNNVKVLDDVVFIGSCLWTDFNNSNPLAMYEASRRMNDYECIRKINTNPYGSSPRLNPEDTVEVHHKSVEFIKFMLNEHRGKKCVVVTHHLPSEMSVHPRFRTDILNPAYYTELSHLMYLEPVIWHHGHTHNSCNYMIDKTEVICNPLGYHASDINKCFDPNCVREI